MNHFANVCRSKGTQAKSVNSIQSTGYILAVSGESERLPKLPFLIKKNQVEMYIDTCSTIDVINEKVYGNLVPRPILKSSKGFAFSYQNSTPIEFVGEFEAEVEFGGRKVKTTISVAKGSDRCLLGYEIISRLKIVKIVNSVEPVSIENLKKRFPKVFSDKLGKLKDYEVKLDIDESIEPVYMKHQRVPFHMRKQLEEVIQKGIENDVFEKADGPTKWLLPAMLVPKPDGRIRFVLDASPANKAIKRTRYVLPTIEDLITDIN